MDLRDHADRLSDSFFLIDVEVFAATAELPQFHGDHRHQREKYYEPALRYLAREQVCGQGDNQQQPDTAGYGRQAGQQRYRVP